MQPFLQAQKTRKHTRFGSVAAQATPSQSDVPTLVSLTMTLQGQNRRIPIFTDGKWVGKPLGLREGTTVRFDYIAQGTPSSQGILYATFPEKRMLRNQQGEPLPGMPSGVVREFLFVRGLSPVNGHGYRGSVHVEVPTDARDIVFYLTKNVPIDVYADYVPANDMKIITTPGMRAELPLNAFRSPSLGFAPQNPPQGGFSTQGERSKHYGLWDGNLDNHGWKKHGYSGPQLTMDSGAVKDGPSFVAPGDPYRTVRSSLYIYRDGDYPEFGGKLKGWDAVRLNAEIPAGIPIALVFKQWYHDRDGGESGKNLLKGKPEWHRREGKVPRSTIWMGQIPHQAYQLGPDGRDVYPVNKRGSAIPFGVSKGWSLAKQHLNEADFASTDGKTSLPPREGYRPNDLRYFGMKVEWWNGSNWSTPSIHPPNDVQLKNGKGMAIFRFPRQLGMDDPDLNVTPFWGLDKTWDCYPIISSQIRPKLDLVKKGVIGRVRVPDEKGNMVYAEVEHNGQRLSATKSVKFHVMFSWGEQVMASGATRFAVADPKTFAYVNSPAFNNVYWKEGEFSPGSSMIVIGQGLKSLFDIGLSTKKGNVPFAISNANRDIDRTSDNAGSQEGDILKVQYVITADQLLDNAVSRGEGEIQQIWKNVFGTELNASWFEIVGTGGKMPDGTAITPLKNQSRNKPTHYTVNFEGKTYEFPYSIAIVKIPKTWVGPILDFEIGEDGKPFLTSKSISKGQKTYICTLTGFQQIVEQELNLDEEIQYQLDMLAKGLTPETVFVGNDTDHDAINTTALVIDQDRKDNLTNQAPPKEGGGLFGGLFDGLFNLFKPRVTNSRIRANSLIPVGTTQLAGFGSGFVMEDITETYSADHTTTLGGVKNPHTMPSHPNNDNFDSIEEVYVMNGHPTTPSLGWFAGASPMTQEDVLPKVVERKQFGSVGGQSMQARATGRGNPMEVTLINGVSRPFRGGDHRNNKG